MAVCKGGDAEWCGRGELPTAPNIPLGVPSALCVSFNNFSELLVRIMQEYSGIPYFPLKLRLATQMSLFSFYSLAEKSVIDVCGTLQ